VSSNGFRIGSDRNPSLRGALSLVAHHGPAIRTGPHVTLYISGFSTAAKARRCRALDYSLGRKQLMLELTRTCDAKTLMLTVLLSLLFNAARAHPATPREHNQRTN
jgi:hypothetical protein